MPAAQPQTELTTTSAVPLPSSRKRSTSAGVVNSSKPAATSSTRIGLTGFAGGNLKSKCDVCVVVPSDSMQVIEDAHLVILHSVFLQLL